MRQPEVPHTSVSDPIREACGGRECEGFLPSAFSFVSRSLIGVDCVGLSVRDDSAVGRMPFQVSHVVSPNPMDEPVELRTGQHLLLRGAAKRDRGVRADPLVAIPSRAKEGSTCGIEHGTVQRVGQRSHVLLPVAPVGDRALNDLHALDLAALAHQHADFCADLNAISSHIIRTDGGRRLDGAWAPLRALHDTVTGGGRG